VNECERLGVSASGMSPLFLGKVDRYPAKLGLLIGTTALAVGSIISLPYGQLNV